jgi:hypothetical protein
MTAVPLQDTRRAPQLQCQKNIECILARGHEEERCATSFRQALRDWVESHESTLTRLDIHVRDDEAPEDDEPELPPIDPFPLDWEDDL